MKLLHFADVHIGVMNYGRFDTESGMNTRVLDFLDAMDYMISIAEEEQVDLTVFAGDAFKTRTPNPTLLYQFSQRVLRLANVAPVVMVVGNHDYVGRGRISPLKIMEDLEAANSIWVLDEITYVDVGYAYVISLPWLYNGGDVEDALDKLERVLDEIGDDDVPRIFVAHCSVEGAVYGSEREIMLGRDTVYPRELFCNDIWDYVALGHIHKHQVLCDDPPVVYAGSIERIDFGERNDSKGFILADVPGTWEFIDIDARPMVVVNSSDIGNVNVEDAIVKLVIDSSDVSYNDVIDILMDAGAHSVAAVYVTSDTERETRLSYKDVEDLSVYDLLRVYWEKSCNYDEHKIEMLLDYAGKVIEMLLDYAEK